MNKHGRFEVHFVNACSCIKKLLESIFPQEPPHLPPMERAFPLERIRPFYYARDPQRPDEIFDVVRRIWHPAGHLDALPPDTQRVQAVWDEQMGAYCDPQLRFRIRVQEEGE